jgi:hypothetical protein
MKRVIYEHVSIQFLIAISGSFAMSVLGWLVHSAVIHPLLNSSLISLEISSHIGFILFLFQLMLVSPLLIFLSFKKIVDWFNFDIGINWLFYVWTEAAYFAFTLLSLYLLSKLFGYERVSSSEPMSFVLHQLILFVIFSLSSYKLLSR